MDASQIAGLNCLRLINDTTAGETLKAFQLLTDDGIQAHCLFSGLTEMGFS